MNHSVIPIQPLKGVDVRYPQDPQAAADIINMCVEADGSLSTRIGYERFFGANTTYAPWNAKDRVTSVFVWERKGGRQSYVLHTIEDTLYYTKGNPADVVELVSGLTEPSRQDPGMTYIPFGDVLVILNGYDEPLIFDGVNVRRMGWRQSPGAPDVWDVDDSAPPWADSAAAGTTRVAVLPPYPDIGVGSGTADDLNRFKYKVSFISDTGAESPLSAQSNDVAWQTVAAGYRYYLLLDGVATGPEGTAARVVYRTQNIEANLSEGEYYRVATIPNNTDTSYWDITNDIELASVAPSDADSILLPVQHPFTGAVFQGSLWLVDKANPYRLWYTVAGTVEQFAASNYVDANAVGGAVQALVPYRQILYAIRDNAIDVVVPDGVGGFTLKPVSHGIGKVAPKTCTAVPGVGVFVLSATGVYILQMNPEGSELVTVQRASDAIRKTIRRMDPGKLRTAHAAYSPKWQEWHCYFDADVGERVGVVFSTVNGGWSIREDFPVGPLCCTLDGDLVFGHYTGAFDGLVLQPRAASGLFVITRRRCAGHVAVGLDQWYLEDADPPESTYTSAWHDVGDPITVKQLRYVYLLCKSSGSQLLTIRTGIDGSYVLSDGVDHSTQPPEHGLQPVWDTATFGTDTWDEPFPGEVRFDVKATGRRVRFSFTTQADIEFMGYALGFTGGVTKVFKGQS